MVTLTRGNPDAFAPTDTSMYQKAMQGQMPPTYVSSATAYAVPGSPDFLVTADFDHDGYRDVLVGTSGGGLYLLKGDGHGNLGTAFEVPLPAQVTALDATPDGHVAVALDGPSGPQVVLLTPGKAGFTTVGSYPLPALAASMKWGTLGRGADLTIGAGSNVVIVYGALSANPQTETIPLTYGVEAVAVGLFLWNRDGRSQISVLDENGAVHILQHGTLDTRPLTAAEFPGRRAARRNAQPPEDPTLLGPWNEAKSLPVRVALASGPAHPMLLSSPLAGNGLIVADAAQNQLKVLDTSGKSAGPLGTVGFSGTPVAAVVTPTRINGTRAVVTLTADQTAPSVMDEAADPVYNVNTTADIDTIGACTNSAVTSTPATLSLREAVCLANNNAPATSTINLPAGAYSLTSFETGELQVETSGTGYTLSIVGAGATGTIIQQTDGVDRILEGDYAFAGNNPINISNVTLQNSTCSTGTDCMDGGGAVLVAGMPNDPFVATSLVVSYNVASAGGYGGGLNSAGSDFTITNSTLSNNNAGSADEGIGGGAYYTDYPSAVEGTVMITNSSFTSNTSALQGGGLSVLLDTGYPMTVTGSTFTGNQVTYSGRDGGGIAVGQYDTTATSATVSNSRIVGNTEPADASFPATGVAVANTTEGILEDNWWGCNAGPGNTGCDGVYFQTSGSYSPWLELSVSANPTSIATYATSTLTADLTHNSSGTGGFSVPNGTQVMFGGTLDSSINPTSTTLSSGTGTSTYTAGGSTGTGTGTATVDNETVSANIDIVTPPAITSASSTTFTVGTAGTFAVIATGTPAPTFSEAGALPSGVTFTSGGVLSGTPAAGTGGQYSITITASNGVSPAAMQTFTLTVDQHPSVTSASSATFTTGMAGSFTVAATGYPTPTFSETGTLPSGVTLTNAGLLSGTPAVGTGGSYSITITAQNGVSPSATQGFTLTVDQPPSITSAASSTFTVGTAGSFTVMATGYPAPTYSESGTLPAGVTLTSAGMLSGTPAAGTGGTYPITITASNGVSSNAMQSFTLTVDQAPVITSAASTTFAVGTAGSFTATASGYPPPTFSETGTLPSGITLSSGGVLSGTPAAGTDGTYPITITAQNGVSPSAMQTFTLTVTQACTNPNPNPNPNPAVFANPGDFNGDCKSDILWRNGSLEEVYEWLMNGTSILSQGSPGGPSSAWVIEGAGDFNGDGKSDILWQNSGSGEVYLWLMNGTAIASQGTPGTVLPSSGWVIAGVGDFDGNGTSDVLWRNTISGDVYLWFMNGTTIASQGDVGVVSPSSGWNIVGVGDFNGDGKADILWQNSTSGEVYLWLMSGTTIASQGSPGTVSPSSGWVIQGTGDFDGNGMSDILWRNSASGEVYIWLMNGMTLAGQGSPATVSSAWSIKGTGDYNGDGKADVLWQNSSGEVYVWEMNGLTITGQGSPGTASSPWQIATLAP